VTTALAIWGAVVSTFLGLLQAITYWRDRPQLHITAKANQTVNQQPKIGISVSNRGSRTTTLVEVGFLVDAEAMVQGNSGAPFSLEPRITLPGTPRVIAAGEFAEFDKPLSEWPGITHIDDPLRAYAVDSHGRTSWGSAIQLLRLLVLQGWKPSKIIDPGLLEHSQGPKMTRPVEPRWKFWVDKSLRTSTDASLEALAKNQGPPKVHATFGEDGEATTGQQDTPS
jgi:hypothetical protein